MNSLQAGEASVDNATDLEGGQSRQQRLVAAGGLIGAIASSSCCVLPLALFSLGASGAWIGNLTALEPYAPVFFLTTLGMLGYGHYLVYRKPACAKGEACAKPQPNRLVKTTLWVSTAMTALALAFPYAAPVLLGT